MDGKSWKYFKNIGIMDSRVLRSSGLVVQWLTFRDGIVIGHGKFKITMGVEWRRI